MISNIDPIDLYLSLTIHFHELLRLSPNYKYKLKEFRSKCVIGDNLLSMRLNLDYLNNIRINDEDFYKFIMTNI